MNDVLKVVCQSEGFDKKSLGKAPTAQHMIREIVKKRMDRAEQMDLLTTIAQQMNQDIDAPTGETPSFATGTFLVLSKCIKDDARNSKLESVRRELIKALTEMTKEAEKEGLDLRPYSGALACSLFLTWCISSNDGFSNAKRRGNIISLPTEGVFMGWVLVQIRFQQRQKRSPSSVHR